MYLRTPKRYQPGRRRRLHLFSTRWLWLWILTPLVILGGWFVYEQRDQLGPPVRQFISDTVDQARGGIATIVAPTALPTSDPADHIVRGDNAWNQGAIEQAVSEYRIAASGAPNDVRVHYRYTYGLLINGDNATALSAAEDTVTANPFSADAWAIRALALERNGRYAEAVASALQSLALEPNNATALAFMSETYLDADKPAQAEEKANQAVNANPDSPEAHYARGRWNAESNFDRVTALEDFQIAHDLAPNLPQVLVDMAQTNFGQGDSALALDQLTQVIESNPSNLNALYMLGYIENQANGDASKAEDYLNRCIQVDPANIPCLVYLAGIKSFSDQTAAAELYQRVIDAGTTNPLYYLRAGRTYANINDCQRATPLLRTGYQMEQQADEPDGERLAAFQEYMSQCGVLSVPLPQTTDGAPLLIPLNGDSGDTSQ